MSCFRKVIRFSLRYMGSDKGLTLVELMVTMGLTTIVLGVIYASYNTQSRMSTKEAVVLNMEQNIRGALYILESQIRMAGYDPTAAGGLGITDIRLKNQQNVPDPNGNTAISFTADLDGNGSVDGNETISFSICDTPTTSPDGILDLAMNTGGGRTVVAESIDALELAYAYDNDGDGKLDMSANGNVLWAIDTGTDNKLDSLLDVNDDGKIDGNDKTGSTTIIPIVGSAVSPDKIRAVKVWILARTKTPLLKYTDNNTYVVANRRITPNDNFKRELLETTIKCKNLGFE